MRALFFVVVALILAAVSLAGLFDRSGDEGDRPDPVAGVGAASTAEEGEGEGEARRGDDGAVSTSHLDGTDPHAVAAREKNRLAIERVDQGDIEAAIDLLREAHALAPADPTITANLASAYNRRGLELLRANDPAAARERFAQASALVGDALVFRLNHAIATFTLKELDRAREEIDAILEASPDDPDALDYRGRLLYRENDLDGAVAAWRRAAAKRPFDAALLSRLEKAERERRAESSMTRDVGSKFAIKFEGGTNDVVARQVVEYLEDAYRAIGYALGHYPNERVEVILYTREQFQAASESAASWVGGLFDGKIRLRVAKFDQHRSGIRRTVVHEYVHVVVKDLAPRCPIWLNEGIAQYFEGGRADRFDEMLRARRQADGPFLSLDELRAPFVRIRDPEIARLAYAQSLSFVAWLIRDAGERSVADYLGAVRDGKAHGEAFLSAFRRSESDAWGLWGDELGR